MRLFSTFVLGATALTDTERSFFKCRDQTYYQFDKVADGGGTEINVEASADNNWVGCHYNHNLPCYQKQLTCSISLTDFTGNGGAEFIQLNSNGIPDHSSWALTGRSSVISEQSLAFRVPKVPVLLDISAAADAPQGAIGMAVNGVSIFGPYNSDCCDATFVEIQTMDYCVGHPANGWYHYHYYAHSAGGYDGCLMSCSADAVSDIVGVMYDGFPLYGPMQYWSPSAGKIYIDPSNCDDCELRQLNNGEVDVCGGVEVADGNSADGTNYRYIVTGLFPYNIQCFRGDYTLSRKQNQSGNWRPYSIGNSCGIGGGGDECDVFNEEWAEANDCTPGNCEYTFANGFSRRSRRGTDDPLSAVYFQCSGCTNGRSLN